ncbi:hypothetical protein CFBP498_32730 [Xanthomonas hortorum pv. vitians]|uniref:Uncharacterized protein n=1 Tax=Xanthomonas hortorum pv. vitians TaxID=83224 RepID=A0A6V7E8X6_9XANT|nr:hypothetical protein XHV734_2645 [Xanthomonas hortorum pv. vitians]CAD0347521.1 hypothetical protein CFBP498_32730 [Xanthomonas hortorum pv. vitians]CAD0347529.1 hypothetical protein CFBP498_32730 [Xanthomonas hortorum pv. vitians]
MWVCCQRHELPVPFGCSKCCCSPRSDQADCGLARANARGVPKRGAGVPARGSTGWGRGGRGASCPGGRFQVNGLIDFFPGARCVGVCVRTDALAGRTLRLGRSESLETASVVQSIGGLDEWRLSDAVVGCLSAARGPGVGGFVGAHLGAMGHLGKALAPRCAPTGVGDLAWSAACHPACCRSAPGRDGPSR